MKIAKMILTAILIAACLIPSALLLFGYQNENTENRILPSAPKLIDDGGVNLDFPAEFGSYFDKNFAMRQYLITAYDYISINLIHDYAGSSVVIGKGDMVYFADTLDDYLGINVLTEEKISTIAAYLLDLQTQYAEQGAEFVFMVAPNKATIYPEYMPDYLYQTDAERNIDMLHEALAEAGVNYIDIKSLLLDAKPQGLNYYYRDSHWNNYGAMLVYNEMAEYMGSAQYDPSTHTIQNDYIGDLNNFIFPGVSYFEPRIIYSIGSSYSTIRTPDSFVKKTESEANDITVLFYHDSFGRSLQPILSSSVGQLTMSSNFDFVSDEKPAIVFMEIVERNIDMLYELAVEAGC